MIFSLIEAALRALLVAMAVWASLRALRVNNVLAQKRTWCLVLISALVMPLAMRWHALPAAMTIALPSQWRQAMARPANAAPAIQSQDSLAASQTVFAPPASFSSATEARSAQSDRFSAPVAPNSGAAIPVRTIQTLPVAKSNDVAPGWRFPQPATLATLLYFAVCMGLLFRLLYGLGAAFRLWQRAALVTLDSLPTAFDGCARGLSLRSSRAVSSPVTIGSGVLLPIEYAEWDAKKLSIVLAHERSHVRQGDFYLQMLAELYTAIFWFSPLGWWLKRKLCDLSETISDRAGLGAAESGPSYAQVLLEFAAMPRLTMRGVAMARPNNLSRRIERLLNESTFRQAFAGGGRRALLAVLLVPVALFTAAALIRVEAASQSTPPPVIAQLAVPPAQPVPPESAVEAPILPPVPAELPAPLPPSMPGVIVTPAVAPVSPAPPEPPALVIAGNGQSMMMTSGHGTGAGQGKGKGYSYGYSYSDNGDSYALISGSGEHNTFSGDWHGRNPEAVEKARHMAHGDFLWFERGGKSYVIDDPAIVSQIQAMYKPMEELGKKQEELGKRQEELGKKQEELGRKMEEVTIPTPDLSKEIAELQQQMEKLKTMQGKTMTTEEWADVESKLGDLQGRLGEIQGEIGAKQGSFGGEMGKLGSQQGKLGAEQGKMGAEQGRMAQEADRKIMSIIDQSLNDGKARPVE